MPVAFLSFFEIFFLIGYKKKYNREKNHVKGTLPATADSLPYQSTNQHVPFGSKYAVILFPLGLFTCMVCKHTALCCPWPNRANSPLMQRARQRREGELGTGGGRGSGIFGDSYANWLQSQLGRANRGDRPFRFPGLFSSAHRPRELLNSSDADIEQIRITVPGYPDGFSRWSPSNTPKWRIPLECSLQ